MYYEMLFNQALAGIASNGVIMPTVLRIAGAILVATLLFNVYQAYAHGGDARTLAVGGIKYLVLGLVFANYTATFTAVNQAFNQMANAIANSTGAGDLMWQWSRDASRHIANSSTWQDWFVLLLGSATSALAALPLLAGLIIFAVTYAAFCVFYSFYGSILFVTGPLVLALYPSMATTGLARTYLVNLLTFHAWGLIYAIMGALLWAINLRSVSTVLGANSAAGFFEGAGGTLLLALTSLLFALCIALIPFLAKRIVQGDVGSTMFAVAGAAMTAFSAGAAALGGASGGFSSATGGTSSAAESSAGSSGAAGLSTATSPGGAAQHSSGHAPTPPPEAVASGTSPAAAASGQAPPTPSAEGTSPRAEEPTPAPSAAPVHTPRPEAPQRQPGAGHPGQWRPYSLPHAVGWMVGTAAGKGVRFLAGPATSNSDQDRR